VNKRDFITLLGGAAASWPLAARAQEPGRIYRLGCLHGSPRDAPHHVAFFDALRRLGFIEGQNLAADGRGYGLHVEQFEQHAAELVKAQVDVILAGGDAAVRATQRATAEILILALTDDMVGQGFVRSLAKPGGNTTGVTILASELDGKRQEILMEAVPRARRIAALADNPQIAGVVKASLSDIKQGSFVGVTAMPRADGSQSALEVHIFPEAMSGSGEGHYPWDLRPQSTMTNANIEQVVTAVDGPTLTLKYKDGEKKIFVPADTPIVVYVPGDKSDLKPGAKVFIIAIKQPDGTLQGRAWRVGRDGVTPPM
jgi:hypothetical protein